MSTDAGATWNDVTANLAAATATVGKVRPSALVLVPTGNGRETALVVGAANGAYATVVQGADGAPRDGKWARLGALLPALPLVMVAGLSYDGESDAAAVSSGGAADRRRDDGPRRLPDEGGVEGALRARFPTHTYSPLSSFFFLSWLSFL